MLEMLRLATQALTENRGRSLLTLLSVTIGAFSIAAMSSLSESALSTMQRGIEELGGARMLLVVPKSPERGQARQYAYRQGLSVTDRERLLGDVPHVAASSLFAQLGRVDVTAPSGARASSSLIASDARFIDAFRWTVERGRSFTEDENRGRSSLCVVGHELADKLGLSSGEDPLGRFLDVGSYRCRVVGILRKLDRFGVSFGFEWNDLVVLPSETLRDQDERVAQRSCVLVTTDAPTSNELVKRLVNARLGARHPGVDDFRLIDFSGAMARFQGVFSALELIVALLAGIALFVGGIGIMNMMLISVQGRVKEIGVKKALGASPRVIGRQFLVESVLLSSLGGGVGVVLGALVSVGAGAMIRRQLPTWQTTLASSACFGAFAVSCILGVGFGWLPARRAAALDPIEAMRR